MSSAVLPRYTLEEYLAQELVATEKHEFFRGEIFQMAGASPRHNIISGNIYHRLRLALDNKPCQPYNSDQRIAVRVYPFHTYPDVSVICGEIVPDARDKHAASNPHTLVEVLSPSTEKYDRGKKFELYRALPSFKQYLIVSQEEPLVEKFVRQDDGNWLLTVYHGTSGEVELAGISCTLQLADIYERVVFGELPE